MSKTYQTPISELRLLLYKALYSNGFNRFAYLTEKVFLKHTILHNVNYITNSYFAYFLMI